MPRRLEKFAKVGGGLRGAHVEAALAGDLEHGASRVGAPLGVRREAREELAADDGHALGGVGAEVILAGRDHARGHATAVALEADALHVAVEVRVVFQHGVGGSITATRYARPMDESAPDAMLVLRATASPT